MNCYMPCFQKKPCRCCQVSGLSDSSGILRQCLGKFLCSPRQPLPWGVGQKDSRGQSQTGILPEDVYREDGISLAVQPAAPELLFRLLEGTEPCLDSVVFPHLLSAGCCGRPPREELQVLHLLLLFWPWHQQRDCIWHENYFSTLQLVT